MSSAIEDFGKGMVEQMRNVMKANLGITVELGTITKNMALSVSSLGNPIPKGDYMISLHLMQASLEIATSRVESLENHRHTVTIPSKLRGLNSGDRVLVAWVGTEPVVIDIVVSS